MSKRLWVLLLITIIVVGLFSGCGAAKEPAASEKQAEKPTENKSFYEGKRLTLIIPNTAGKGMDTYGRLVVPYLKEELGVKDIVVKNVVGAGGVVGMNEVFNAKPDGLTIGFGSGPTAVLSELSEGEGVGFKATEMTWFGRAAVEPKFLVVGGESKLNSMGDIKNMGRDFIMPAQGIDDDFYTMAILMNSFGTKLHAITGYQGEADTDLAVVKGEADGHLSARSSAATMIKEGDKKPLMVLAEERIEGYPDVPSALEVVDEQTKSQVEAIVNIYSLHRSFFGPPGIDESKVKEARDALARALQNKELLDKAAGMGRPMTHMPGDIQAKKVKQIADTAQKLVPILKEAVESVK